MYNIIRKHRRWRLVTAILSLSLLTVMAGAAVAPALGLFQAYFADSDQSLVQMIVSMPALFIAGTNLLLFRPLCKRFKARSLLIFSLLLYTVFGCAAGLFDSISDSSRVIYTQFSFSNTAGRMMSILSLLEEEIRSELNSSIY